MMTFLAARPAAARVVATLVAVLVVVLVVVSVLFTLDLLADPPTPPELVGQVTEITVPLNGGDSVLCLVFVGDQYSAGIDCNWVPVRG